MDVQMPNLISLLLYFLTQSINGRVVDINILDNCIPNTNVLDLDVLLNPDGSQTNIKFTLTKVYRVSEYFEIRNNKIFTKSTINIDQMCSTINECCNKELDYCNLVMSLFYTLNSNSLTQMKDLQIQIKDFNDHTPQFPDTSVEIRLSESKRDPYFILLPLANDGDFGRNRIQDYQINSKEPMSFDDFFILIVNRESSVPPQVSLKLTRNLDRETISSISFQLLAIDGGQPTKKTGSMMIKIIVTDENDNSPIFQKPLYRENLLEGVLKRDPIIELFASDIDEGENARIVYSLSPKYLNDNSITDKFEIQPSGKIYLKKALDYEKQRSYKFLVTASNPTPFANNTLVPAVATVEVEVENVDDEPLQIIVTYIGGQNLSLIPENHPGMFIALLTTRSIEFGRRSFGIACSLDSYENIFQLIPKSGGDQSTKSFEVRTVVGIDREQYPRIETTVTCRESSSDNSKFSKASLVVKVTDENDNAPKLSVDGVTIVKENEVVGKVIFTVRAFDPDERENGRVSFSLDKSDSMSLEYLTIGELDGKVRVRNKIDCEVTLMPLTSLDIVVTATDHGRSSRSSDLNVHVNVTDVNDNSPVFLTNPLQFSVVENSPPFSLIGEIEVQDKDHSDQVTLRVMSSNQQIPPFTITTQDHKIFFLNTTKSIDRETDAMFKFSIVASDGTGPGGHSVTETVEVRVIDVNDNAPTIIFPTQNNASVHSLSYSEPINHKFILVSANDQDQMPDNSRLEYSIDDGDLKLFGISNEDKYITTQRTMNKQDLGEHRMQIIVSDCGIPPLKSSVVISIFIDQSTPKSLSSNNLRPNNGNGDQRLSANSDIILYVTVTIIIFVIIIVTVVFVYFIRRCKKEDNCFHTYVSLCCPSLQSSSYGAKSIISSIPSKTNCQDGNMMYNNSHQLPLINNGNQFDRQAVNEHWNDENSRVPSYNIISPYMSSVNPYAKLANVPPPYYPLQHPHHYQTIEENLLNQRNADLSMVRVPSYQLRGKNNEHYKSELNLKRWNDVVSPDSSSTVQWVTSQTPLPTRYRRIITDNVQNNDLDDDNFAVAFPQEQSTFV